MGKLAPNAKQVPRWALPIVVGRASEMDLQLTEPTVSRRHARIELQGGQLWVQDLESRFGTFVNGQQVRCRRLSVGDQVRFGKLVTYRVTEQGLDQVEEQPTGLRLHGLEIAVRDRVLVSFGDWQWEVPAGRFVGILGPSGAGKTMLLRTIAGLHRPSRGWIACGALDNIWESEEQIETHRRQLAYIPQQDVVYDLLTVRENLECTAQLRLGQRMTPEQQQKRVEEALEFFGLKEHADKLARVLSGGQRKRLSVAMEWLREPKLLLLDEPTAGLDPANEARLMENFKQLARRGTTVLCTTHLMNHIYLLDEVLVLGVQQQRGVPAYAGDPEQVLPSFQCPNFADVYEKLEHGHFFPLSGQQTGGHLAPVGSPGAQPSAAPGPKPIGGMGDGAAVPAGPKPVGSPGAPPARQSEPLTPTPGTGRSLQKLAIPPEKQIDPVGLKVVAQRTWLSLWRDRWMRWMLLGQPVILSGVLALTQFSPGKIFGIFFFTTVVACWLGMNNSIRDLVRDRRGYIRDRLGGLAPGSYLLAKGFVYGLVGICQLAVFLLLVRILVPLVLPASLCDEFLERSFGGWLGWWGALWMVYLGGLTVSLIVSTLVDTEEAAVAWLPILILPQILLSTMGTGCAGLEYTDPRPFRPVVVSLRYPTVAAPFLGQGIKGSSGSQSQQGEKLSAMALLVDGLSLFLVCRPGVLLVEHPHVADFGRFLWVGDLCHLGLLILGGMLGLWQLFLRQERYWPSLIGY
jgi:ABC-type multidrug transport system ATPase subunit